MFGPQYHLFSFHMKNVTLFSGNANRLHSSPAPVGASPQSPRPFLGGARPRGGLWPVCVCMCVCISSRGRLTSNYPLAQNYFSSRFQCPQERRPPRITAAPRHGLYSFASFFSGELIASLSELSQVSSSRANTGFAHILRARKLHRRKNNFFLPDKFTQNHF